MYKKVLNLKVKSIGLLLGMSLLAGCSSDNQIVNEPQTVTIETEQPKPVYKDRYASDYRRQTLNPVFSDEEWTYAALYQRDVRHYTDGSTGFSEWEYKGEYYIRYADIVNGMEEYSVEELGKVNIHNAIASLLEDENVQVYYAGSAMLNIENLKVFRLYTRDFVDGEYTDFSCNGNVYLSDDEVIDNDLIDLDIITDELTMEGLKVKKLTCE